MALAVRIRGAMGAGVPFVLLHGFGAAGFVWDPVSALLPDDSALIIPDLPGHGGSLNVAPGGAGRIAKTILAELVARDIPKCHVVGHSLGGASAALMALFDPSRVASLTLVAPGGFGPKIHHRALHAYANATDELAMRAALEPFFAAGAVLPQSLVDGLVTLRSDPEALVSLKTILSAMLTEASGRTEQGVLPIADLARLAIPKTIIWGEQDEIVPVGQADGLDASFKVHRVENCGHMVLDEAPGIVAEVMSGLA